MFELRATWLLTVISLVGCGAGPGAQPRDVPGTFTPAAELHVGTYAVCIVDAGVPSCFAVDSSRGSYDERATRKPVPLGFLAKTSLFSLTGSFGCAVDAEGKVGCFEASMSARIEPARKAPFLDDALMPPVAMAAGGDGFTNFVCVANAEQRVGCHSDSLGPSPTLPPDELRAKQLSAGKGHVCAITPEGGAFCWGSNDYGELGHEGFGREPVRGLPGPVVEVAAGEGHTCARAETGEVWCWGKNDQGQLGFGEISEKSVEPRQVRGLAGPAAELALGADHSCARLVSGAVQCWGDNTGGVLGDGSESASATPVAMLGVTDVVRVGAGAYQTCALSKSGRITCFGMSEVISMTIDLNDLVR